MCKYEYSTGEQVKVIGSGLYGTMHLDGKQGTIITTGFFSCDIEIDGEVNRIMSPYIKKVDA